MPRGFVNIGMMAVFLFCGFSQAFGAVPRKWTYLFFVAGDEPDIDAFSRVPLRKLEHLPSDNDRWMVAQTDLYLDETGKNRVASPSRRYVITPHGGPIDPKNYDTLKINSQVVWQSKEKLLSASPDTLSDFLSWSKANYPSEHYGLFLLGHGWGWRGLLEDDNPVSATPLANGKPPEFVLSSLAGLRQAVSKNFSSSSPLDLVVMDLCNMGGLEVAYELRGLTRYLVATPGEMPFMSFDYEKSLAPLPSGLASGLPGAANLAKRLVSDSIQSFSRGGSQTSAEGSYPPVSLFALDMNRMQALWPLWSRLGAEMSGTNFSALFMGTSHKQWLDDDAQIDIVELLTKLRQKSDSVNVRRDSSRLLFLMGEPNPAPSLDSQFFEVSLAGADRIHFEVADDELLGKEELLKYFPESFETLNPAFKGVALRWQVEEKRQGQRTISAEWPVNPDRKKLWIRPFLPGAQWAKLELYKGEKLVKTTGWEALKTFVLRSNYPATSPYLMTGHTFGAGRSNGLSVFLDTDLDVAKPENNHWTGTDWIAGEAYYRSTSFARAFHWADLLFGRSHARELGLAR